MIQALSFIPLFVLFLLAYWVMHLVGISHEKLYYVAAHIQLPSGTVWKPTWGDLMILLGIIALYVELFKATRTSSISIVDHTLSTFVLVGFLVSWMIFPWAGNSVFLILTFMSFLDVIAGFTITIATARRDFAVGGK
ncbi:MAG: hypothetical protein DSZ29_06395 [Aquificaceae bacterium]|nr:MAG: hypothetical protein DSZ29_06395 [Aquificaceae bacterium]